MATLLNIAKQQNYNVIFNELVKRQPTLDDIIPYSMQIFKPYTNNISFNQKDFQNTFIDIAKNPNRLKEYSISLCLYAEFIRATVNRKSLLNTAVIIANQLLQDFSSAGCVTSCCDFGIPSDEFKEGMTHEIYLKNKILEENDPAFIKKLSNKWNYSPPKHTRGNYRTKVFELCQDSDYDYAIAIVFDSTEKTSDFSEEYLQNHRRLTALDKASGIWDPNSQITRSYDLLTQKMEEDHKPFSSLIKDIRNMPRYSYNKTELDSSINCICQLLPQLYKKIPELYTLHTNPDTAKGLYERALSQRRPTKPAVARYTRDAFPEFADVLEGSWKQPSKKTYASTKPTQEKISRSEKILSLWLRIILIANIVSVFVGFAFLFNESDVNIMIMMIPIILLISNSINLGILILNSKLKSKNTWTFVYIFLVILMASIIYEFLPNILSIIL